MGRQKCWKWCVREFIYCKPKLNRRLLCICRSVNEVCEILNTDICHGKNKRKNGKCG